MAKLEIQNLRKDYDGFSLGPIDLQLQPGSAHGLIGPNGAGKSTLMHCIVGAVRGDTGRIEIDGKPIDGRSGLWRQSIGYVGDYTPLIEHWSGARNLKAVASFYEAWSDATVADLASRIDLDLDRKAETYSTGQRTKLSIVRALSHGATLLLLDEPATGLDPLARDAFMEVLFEQMQDERLNVLYATHHVSELEQLASELIFIDSGQIVARETKDDLENNWRRITFHVSAEIGEVPNHVFQRQQGDDYEVITADQQGTLSFLQQSGAQSIQSSRLTIDQICVRLLKNNQEK